jgi:diguanylate cyclase (GGDEF)-like protein
MLSAMVGAGVALAATATVVDGVRRWHTADAIAHVGDTYVALQAGAGHEAQALRLASEQPRSGDARRSFFRFAVAEASLLSRAQSEAPASQQARLRQLVNVHNAALARAGDTLANKHAGATRDLSAARHRLALVERLAANLRQDLALTSSRPWPSTATQRAGLGALSLLVLVGLGCVARSSSRLAGLRRSGHVSTGDSGELERLTRQARSDSLTGFGNHRAFQDDLLAAIDRCKTNAPVTLVAFDLDNLKQINDRQGHNAGDLYITTVAACIRETIADAGQIYRTGGDEFMAILHETRAWHALTYAHAIQRAAQTRTGRRALSIGLAESTGSESHRTLVHQADLALYEAKRARLLAVTYHPGLDRPKRTSTTAGPTDQQKTLAAALASAVDAKDANTRNHSETVADLCAAVGAKLGLTGERLERLRIAGLLHDVGKIGIADDVLGKPGTLDAEERSAIQVHPTISHSILTRAELHQEATWVLHHHERLDGTGYPAGLADEEIPLESRIIAVADAFEAMTGGRPYRDALTPEQALAELTANSGSQFDPCCVQAIDRLFGGHQHSDPTPAAVADRHLAVAVA